MSYEKQNWKNGDVITESKLNHMEDGIATGGGVLVVNAITEGQTTTLDKTWQEIHDAPIAVIPDILDNDIYKTVCIVSETGVDDGNYWLTAIDLKDIANPIDFNTDSADGYPSGTIS